MDRCALFVDAAYLYAAGGSLCCDTTKREELVLDFPKAIAALRDTASGLSPLPVLRIYWYDAAKDAVPTPTHIRVGSLQGVQLRLGRLTHGVQKGVDSRIIRDLIVLSGNKAISDALLLSGDDDLREGVSEAQDFGVSVTLIGVEPLEGLQNQAPTLVRAVDATVTLTKAQVTTFLTRVPIDTTEVAAGLANGAEFAAKWASKGPTADQVRAVIATKPKLPPALFGDLVRFAGPKFGMINEKPALRRALLDGFWKGFLERFGK
jgi:uncharacterized LabA/DUF88 family protein